MLSNTCKYAIRSVIYLALNSVNGEKIGIKKISEDLAIPSPFLGKIMQVLAKNKILASTKGPNGGFSLGKPPKKISLMDIVDVIDGDDRFNACVIGLQSCSKELANCPIHDSYAPIREEAKRLFIKLNIYELADSIRKSKNTIVI